MTDVASNERNGDVTKNVGEFADLATSSSNVAENDDSACNSNLSNWDNMFSCLKAYKALHGDTFVPATYPANPRLGNWVDNQRQAYRMRLEVEQGITAGNVTNHDRTMTDDRIEKLNSIGKWF